MRYLQKLKDPRTLIILVWVRNRVSISTLSSQPLFDKHIEFGTQFAYRNADANSICLSKRSCELNLLIETRFGGSGGGCRQGQRGARGARDKRGERGEESEESNRVSISTLSSQPRFDEHIELGTQFAYRNAVANSICLSKRGWEHNLLIETRFGVSGGGGCQKERESERRKKRERQERRERRGERGEQTRFTKHSEFANALR